MEGGFPPNERCLACEVCCRFNEAGSLMAPVFSAAEMAAAERAGLPATAFCHAGYGRPEPAILRPGGSTKWVCPGFDEARNRCAIYAARPLDCRLYPFVLCLDEAGTSVRLAADLACPFVVDSLSEPAFSEYAQGLCETLDAALSEQAEEVPCCVGFHRPEYEVLCNLPRLTLRVCRSDLGLARLTPQSAADLEPFFAAEPRECAHHALAAVFVWADFFDLYYKVVGDRLLLFGEADGAAFLWLPPVGRGALEPAVEEAVSILRPLGRQPHMWRIDNVGAEQVEALSRMGLRVGERTEEFVYDRARLAALAGRPLHGSKAGANFFVKHHGEVAFGPLGDGDIPEALGLYRRWSAARLAAHTDDFYRAQMEAAMLMHYRALRHAGGIASPRTGNEAMGQFGVEGPYTPRILTGGSGPAGQLGLVGRSLRADGGLVGYTVGYRLPGTETAVILLEVADPAVQGAGAYLLREFARWWSAAHPPPARLNAMGDSGLPNLRRAKLAHRPECVVPLYTARPARSD